MKFEIKTDLPISTQKEIERIEAIVSGARTAQEIAFMTAVSPYLTNEIISSDDEGLIISARGLTLPTSYPNFAKGASFIKTDATGNGLYINIGTSTSALFSLIDEDKITLTRALTSAELKGMFAAPLTLVAGIAGKTIVVDEVVLSIIPGAVAYTGGGDVVVGTADADCITAIPKALILSVATDTYLCSIAKGINISVNEAQGLDLRLGNKDAAFATGTVGANIIVNYHLI